MKKNIYFFQFNTPTNRNLLPLAMGQLISYSESIELIKDNINIETEILRKKSEDIISNMNGPDLAAFSCYSWNTNQSMRVADAIKNKWPGCKIVIGGPSVPPTIDEINNNPKFDSVDFFVIGEGEITFSEILLNLISYKETDTIDGIIYRKENQLFQTDIRNPIKDLNILPSPYLNGFFEKLLKKYPNTFTGTLWETNRGCPFSCTFCYWGQSQKAKIRLFDMERLSKELHWISQKEIGYIYACDGNFGIVPRDVEIGKKIGESFKENGYPWYFMINWTKHSSEIIFKISSILRDSGVKFNVTLSKQSFNESTLRAVKRVNMADKDFFKSVEYANKNDFPVYTDIIMALPEETYDSFLDGLEKVYLPYLNYHYSIYLCRLLTGSEMNNIEYKTKYNLKTRNCIVEMSRRATTDSNEHEFEDIVVSTNTLPLDRWKELYKFSYFSVVFYNYRLGYYVSNFLKNSFNIKINDLIKFIIDNANQLSCDIISKSLRILSDVSGSILSEDSSLSTSDYTYSMKWESYEASLLYLINNKNKYYSELYILIKEYLSNNDYMLNELILKELFCFQYQAIPSSYTDVDISIKYNYDFLSYFDLKEKSVNAQLEQVKINIKNSTLKNLKNYNEFVSELLIGGHTFKIYDFSKANNFDIDSIGYFEKNID